MPRRPVPAEILEAASEHSRDLHGHALAVEEVGRPTARATVITVTWDEDESLGPRFLCRRCEPGSRRYIVAVERPQPTTHLRELIRRHFADNHERPLEDEELAFESHVVAGARAVFIPMLIHLGAGIVCQECPPGLNRLYLTPPPHGDARRIQYLLRTRPKLREHTRLYSSQEQAEYVEAFDRGLLQLDDRLAGRRTLRRARATRAEPSALDDALGKVLRSRSPDGVGISAVIKRLHELSLASPTALALEVATVLPGFDQLAPAVEDEQLAAAVARALEFPEGELPTTNASQLWRIWASVKS